MAVSGAAAADGMLRLPLRAEDLRLRDQSTRRRQRRERWGAEPEQRSGGTFTSNLSFLVISRENRFRVSCESQETRKIAKMGSGFALAYTLGY